MMRLVSGSHTIFLQAWCALCCVLLLLCQRSPARRHGLCSHLRWCPAGTGGMAAPDGEEHAMGSPAKLAFWLVWGGQPGGLVLVMSKQRCFICSNRDLPTQTLKHSQKEGQHPHGGLTEGDTEARGIHESCQEHILDRTMFDNSRQAFSSREIHTCPEIDFI